MVWDGERKAGHAWIGVGTDHRAVRQEKLPFSGHFRRIRTAYRRCVQWPHPTKRRGTTPYGVTSGSHMVWDGERKAGHAWIGVGTDHRAVRQEKLPFSGHFRRIRTACQRCVQWPHPTKRRSTTPYGRATSLFCSRAAATHATGLGGYVPTFRHIA